MKKKYHNKSQAQKLLGKAFSEYKKKLGADFQITQLARDIGLPYSTVYNPLIEKRMCNADTWILLMKFFEKIEIHGKIFKVKK